MTEAVHCCSVLCRVSVLTLHLQHKAQHTVSSRVLGTKVDGEVVHLQESKNKLVSLLRLVHVPMLRHTCKQADASTNVPSATQQLLLLPMPVHVMQGPGSAPCTAIESAGRPSTPICSPSVALEAVLLRCACPKPSWAGRGWACCWCWHRCCCWEAVTRLKAQSCWLHGCCCQMWMEGHCTYAAQAKHTDMAGSQ